jgi:2'-5' RNA ligase
MTRDDTFVVTLRLDEVSFTRLEQLRRRHFPPDINLLPAHLTLFHALNHEQVSRLPSTLPSLTVKSIPLQFVRPTLIGRGVAIEVACGELSDLHARMIEALGHGLTRQDRKPFRPHVTIQNKVTREAAKVTFSQVANGFSPWAGHGIGLDVWRYLGGPWAQQSQLSFVQATKDERPPSVDAKANLLGIVNV